MVMRQYPLASMFSTLNLKCILSWRRQRKAVYDIFSLKAAEKFHVIQTQSAIEAVQRILAHPDDWQDHMEQ